jgi:hypothetical protein
MLDIITMQATACVNDLTHPDRAWERSGCVA